MLRTRKGVTLLEIMTVMVLAVLATAIAVPRFRETQRASSMQSARSQVESYLAVARAVAVRNGVKAYLIRDGNTIRIMADSAGQLVVVVRPVKLDEVSKVSLGTPDGSTADTIVYDNRGLATNLGAGGEKFYITSALDSGVKDSVCVNRLGLVFDRKCGLAVMPPEKDILIEDPIIIGPPIHTVPIVQ